MSTIDWLNGIRYQITSLGDNTYEVSEFLMDRDGMERKFSTFTGSLADCYAWICLKREGVL
jgi:hypothetical protein